MSRRTFEIADISDRPAMVEATLQGFAMSDALETSSRRAVDSGLAQCSRQSGLFRRFFHDATPDVDHFRAHRAPPMFSIKGGSNAVPRLYF